MYLITFILIALVALVALVAFLAMPYVGLWLLYRVFTRHFDPFLFPLEGLLVLVLGLMINLTLFVMARRRGL